MTHKYYSCDHCRKVLDEMKDYVDIQIELCGDTVNTDLCKSCYEDLLTQIRKYTGDTFDIPDETKG